MSGFQRYLTSYTKTGIDLKTATSTVLFTTDNGTERFYPLFIVVEITTGSVITVVATASYGVTAAAYNDILVATAMTGLTATNKMIMFNCATTAISSVAANTGVRINVTIGATATTATGKVTMYGYYE